MNRYYIIYGLSVLIASISQVLLKISADKRYDKRLNEIFNPFVLTGYTLFVTCTVLTVIAFKGVPLQMGPIIESLGYVFIMFLSRVMFNERITIKRLMGNGLIIIGIIVFSL